MGIPSDIDAFGFGHSYRVDPDPEFPPGGRWQVPVYHFAGESFREVDGPEGSGVYRIDHPDGSWIASFPTTVQFYTSSDPDVGFAFIEYGPGYLIDMKNPGSRTKHMDLYVVSVARAGDGLIVGSWIDLTLLNPDRGIVWRTVRLCADALTIVGVGSDEVHCSGEFIGETREFEVSLADGTSNSSFSF